MQNNSQNVYSWDQMPKYIQWNKSKSTTYYYSPLVFKKENERDLDAYVAMYARQFFRSTGLSFRTKDYLFRVEAPTLSEALERFMERFMLLQREQIIDGRYLQAEKIERKHRELVNEKLYYQTRDDYRRKIVRGHGVVTSIILALTILMTSCGLKRQVAIYDTYPATPGRLAIYQTGQQLPNDIIQVGTVVVGEKGATTTKNCTYEACMEAIQEEAKKMGGHIIYIVSLKEPSFWGSTCYNITADIYRYPEIK